MARLEIKIRNKNGEYKKYEQNWVPTRKMLEALDIDSQTYPDLKELNENKQSLLLLFLMKKKLLKMQS